MSRREQLLETISLAKNEIDIQQMFVARARKELQEEIRDGEMSRLCAQYGIYYRTRLEEFCDGIETDGLQRYIQQIHSNMVSYQKVFAGPSWEDNDE